jgi:pSer/pThr/pTyr-binding forkhead associated (FHA) protein
MKVSLTVLVTGKMRGKTIPINGSKFLIGRDEKCQLRPASPMVSKRHCLLFIRDNKLFVQDLGSTNGTLVNDQQIAGESQLSDRDRLTVGPLSFAVVVEDAIPAQVSSVAATARASDLEDSAADMLLAMPDESGRATAVEDAATGSTIMDLPLRPSAPDQSPDKAAAAEKKKDVDTTPAVADTSSAAKVILDKYLRRPR